MLLLEEMLARTEIAGASVSNSFSWRENALLLLWLLIFADVNDDVEAEISYVERIGTEQGRDGFTARWLGDD